MATRLLWRRPFTKGAPPSGGPTQRRAAALWGQRAARGAARRGARPAAAAPLALRPARRAAQAPCIPPGAAAPACQRPAEQYQQAPPPTSSCAQSRPPLLLLAPPLTNDQPAARAPRPARAALTPSPLAGSRPPPLEHFQPRRAHCLPLGCATPSIPPRALGAARGCVPPGARATPRAQSAVLSGTLAGPRDTPDRPYSGAFFS
ncbi:MAG: hypothetical protein J3K34DRAFT_423218 [Monoraphidium minutum]|nr:MAG: hypothetical protein J3K34DRAFT_423218 [Monoraphidium minutum]